MLARACGQRRGVSGPADLLDQAQTVKREIIQGLAPAEEWATHPMYFDPNQVAGFIEMKLFIVAVACLLLATLAGACSEPSDEQVEAKYYELVGRINPLLEAIVASRLSVECLGDAGFFDLELSQRLTPENLSAIGNREAMAEMKRIQKGLDKTEAALKDFGCIDGNGARQRHRT